MKSFIPNAAMVYARSFGLTPDSNGSPRQISTKFGDPLVLIDDEVIKISAIILRPMEESSHVLDSPQSGLNETKPGDLSVIYICELPEIKGKFDPKKASSLGLKPGPKYRELQLGNSVKSDYQNIMVDCFYVEKVLQYAVSLSFSYLNLSCIVFFRYTQVMYWVRLFLVLLYCWSTAQR